MAAPRRFSRQREAIIHNLQNRCDHPSADEIYTAIRQQYPHISLGTVYRNLRELEQEGQALKFTCDGKERFDGNTQPHYHFVCDICGEVYDVFDAVTGRIAAQTAQAVQGEVHSVQLVVRGRCKSCAK